MKGHYNNHKSNNGISVINLLNYYLDVNVVVFNNNNYENNQKINSILTVIQLGVGFKDGA